MSTFNNDTMKLYKLKFESIEQGLAFIETLRDGLIGEPIYLGENEFDIVHQDENLVLEYEVHPTTIIKNRIL